MAIHLLDSHTAELIAAGEVVERPASVVKELAENAIDAGAREVRVEIERGGIALIRVSDNGAGIEAADIPLAFVRHATSKVRTEADLVAIGTLGFRGEALASIASVAKVELLTKHDADEFANLYRVGGVAKSVVEPAARPRGTSITVRDLFYNTPARMKFLKKDSSEAGYVTETVTRLALSHPEVSFKYMKDGKQVFETPGSGKLRDAVWAALGAAFARDLIEVAGTEAPVRAHGLVTPPIAGRASRSMQFFFINGRFVKNRTMMAALEQAYRGRMMHGKFPGGVLFVEMPHEMVDVNVHPAKTEVRFARESDIFDAVYRAVKAALIEAESSHAPLAFSAPPKPEPQSTADSAESVKPSALHDIPAARPGQVRAYNDMIRRTVEVTGALASPESVIAYETRQPTRPILRPNVYAEAPPPAREAGHTRPEKAAPPAQTSFLQQAAEAPAELRLVGELFRTYIIAEQGETMCLIDKHAAHERLLYEKLAAQQGDVAAQQLLAPITVLLGAEEKNALLQSQEALQSAGLEVDDFGGGSVLVRAVPADIDTADVEALVEELGGRLALNSRDNLTSKKEWVLHSVACRAAVKAGDKTPPQALLALASAIISGQIPPFCPHGRPVVLEMTKKELEKQFGRLG